MSTELATQTTDLVSSPEKLNPMAAARQAAEEIRPTLLTVDDATREGIIEEAAKTEAVLAFLSVKQEVSHLEYLNSKLRLRRLFPASESVRAILGDDACDLIGETPEYKAAVEQINASALRSLVSRFKRDGYPSDMASEMAKNLLAKLHGNTSTMTTHIRKAIDAVVLASVDGDTKAAEIVLRAHGFKHLSSIETKKAPQLVRPAGDLVAIDPKDKAALKQENVRYVNGKPFVVSQPAPKVGDQTPANAPAEQSDQTPPSETADALTANLLKALGEGAATDPNALINQAVGMLRQAQSLIAKAPGKVTAKQREAHRKALTSAYRTLMGELEENLSADQAPEATPASV